MAWRRQSAATAPSRRRCNALSTQAAATLPSSSMDPTNSVRIGRLVSDRLRLNERSSATSILQGWSRCGRISFRDWSVWTLVCGSGPDASSKLRWYGAHDRRIRTSTLGFAAWPPRAPASNVCIGGDRRAAAYSRKPLSRRCRRSWDSFELPDGAPTGTGARACAPSSYGPEASSST